MGFFKDLQKGYEQAKKAKNVIDQVAPGVSGSQQAPQQFEFQALHFAYEPGMDRVDVVGESYYQSAISNITGRVGAEEIAWEGVAALVPEEQNRKDSNATAIYIEGQHVGYLSSEAAALYAPAVQGAVKIGKLLAGDARIYAYPPERARTPNAGVTLYLPTPAEIIEQLPQHAKG